MTTKAYERNTFFEHDPAASVIELTVEGDHIPKFFPLLQCGVGVMAQVDVSLRSFLCDHFQVDSSFLDLHLKTVFLDSKPVDDIDSAIVRDGSIVALSAAMPGLVGATMRRGGPLAGFRCGITHDAEQATDAGHDGRVTLKLFNLLINVFGPRLLSQGVYVKRENLEDFFRNQPRGFWKGCRGAKIGQKEIALERLPGLAWPETTNSIHFKVIVST